MRPEGISRKEQKKSKEIRSLRQVDIDKNSKPQFPNKFQIQTPSPMSAYVFFFSMRSLRLVLETAEG